MNALDEFSSNRITRILTTDFPQYFAIITRIRQEIHAIGPEGGMVSSTVVPQVQAIFPEGALTKKIKVGLQVGNSIEILEADGNVVNKTKKTGRLEGFRQRFRRKAKPNQADNSNHVTENSTKALDKKPEMNNLNTKPKKVTKDKATQTKRIKKRRKARQTKADPITRPEKLRDGPSQDRFRPPPSGGCFANFVRAAVPNLDIFARMI